MAWTPFTRLDHDRSGQRYTSDMTEREFALISPHLPGQPRRGRKRRTNLRAVVDGIFDVLPENALAFGLVCSSQRSMTNEAITVH